jgi:hypothetical protein
VKANPWGRDHPHIRSPKGVMSCEEIRHWFVALRRDHGWAGALLARTVGLPDKGAMTSKLRRSWIYPGEQLKFSRQLDRILSGELVPLQIGRRWEAVLADNPKPLVRQARMAYDFATGRVRWVTPRIGVDPTLPGFQQVMTRVLPIVSELEQ